MRCKVEAGKHNHITQDEYTTAMVIALRLDIRVRKQKDGEDDGDDVPPREDERKCVCASAHMPRVVPCAKGHHGRDLEEADLQCIGRTDFHAMLGFKVH